MKNDSIRILTCLLSLLMLVSLFASCGGETGPSEATTAEIPGAATTATPEVTTTEADLYNPNLSALDWNGDVFMILYNGNEIEPNLDFVAEELTGATLNDAVYKRNKFIEEKHKLVIKSEYYTDKNILEKVKSGIDAGDDVYQLVEVNQNYSMTLAINGQIKDFAELTSIDLTKPYWNANLLSGSTINKRNFFAYSDANVHAFGATPCTIFNKKVLTDNNLENIYDIVNSGKWTHAKMSEMVKVITADIDGDGKITEKDNLGMIANTFSIDCFISGSGYKMMTKDEDDFPVLNVQTEQFYNIIDSIKDLCDEKNGMYLVDRVSTTTEAREYWPINALTDNRALFLIGNLKDVEKLRTYDCDFGVVPIPKVNEEQENYMIHLQANIGAAMSVPASVTKTSDVSIILEDIAYASYLDVMPIYMEVLIQGKSIRDSESLECLKLIRNSYYCDIGFMLGNYGINVLDSMRTVVKNNTSVTTALKVNAKTYEKALKSIKEAFNG